MSPYKEVKLTFKLRWQLYNKEDRELSREIGLQESEWTTRVVIEIEDFAELDRFVPKIEDMLKKDILNGIPEEWKKFSIDCELAKIDFRITRSTVIDRKDLI